MLFSIKDTVYGAESPKATQPFCRAGQNAQFAGTGQRASPLHLAEKLCSLFLLDTQRHTSERAGKRDRGGSAVSARYIRLEMVRAF
jgi:hypothetical protein